MDTALKGKKALITGGGQGIGLAIAKALADEGVDVAIANRASYPNSEAELATRKVRVVGLQADVSNETNVVRMVDEAIARLGGLDIYVNNIAAHWDEAALRVTATGWQATVAANLSACVYGCREAGRQFVRQGSGSILIIGSTASHAVNPGEIAYRVTKGALVPYMEGLSAEMAPHGVRVNMLTPGFFLTRMTSGLGFNEEALRPVLAEIPLRRPGDAYAELGPAAIFLLSDHLSGYTTGANLVVDGGLTLRVLKLRSDEELSSLNV